MTKRYEQLLARIDLVRPRVIVEVGVHNGVRASLMSRCALTHHKDVRYTGYDVFGMMDAQFHADVLNGKGIPSQAAAKHRLARVAAAARGFRWEFVVGLTQETLHGRTVTADFAFIDGDHRVEAIRADAAALDARELVFDDYYLPGPDGRLPDLARYGANRVVEEYRARGAHVELLPLRDRCDHGAWSVLAVVRTR